MDYTDPVGPVASDCRLPETFLRQPETTAIAALMQHYATARTQVYLYLSPVPACGNADEVSAKVPRTLDATSPRILPPGWFAADRMYAHVLPSHVSQGTEVFIHALRQWGLGVAPGLAKGTTS